MQLMTSPYETSYRRFACVLHRFSSLPHPRSGSFSSDLA